MSGNQLEAFAEHCVKKLLFLEERLGRNTGYEILEPFPVDAKDVCSVQNAARRIADHIKLPPSTTLVVGFSRKKEGTGGDVEIRDWGREGYIEISPDTKKFPAAVSATLAHEVSHVALAQRGISEGSGPIYEKANEQLTDIAAVFLGLGKILLNGKAVTSRTLRQGHAGTEDITTHMSQGYLSDDQLAFTYSMVCAMRAIPSSAMLSGLSPHALAVVDRLGHLRKQWLSPTYREPEYTDRLINEATDRLINLEERVQSLNSDIESLKREVIDPAYREIDRVQRELSEGNALISKTKKRHSTDQRHDPCWRFLSNLQSRDDLHHELDKIEEAVERATGVRTFVRQFLSPEKEARSTSGGHAPGKKRNPLSRLAMMIWRKAQ